MQVYKHFGHHHALRPFVVRDGEEESMTCSGCEKAMPAGSAYRCSKPKCEYFLHGPCSSLPQQINHRSHPDHALTLLHQPPYPDKEFICNACGETSSAFTYHCPLCTYDLHVGCANMPLSLKLDKHPHPLSLFFPNGDCHRGLNCDVCHETVDEKCWFYHCIECDFESHLECTNEEADKPEEQQFDGEEEEVEGEGGEATAPDDYLSSMLEAQRKFQILQLEYRIKSQNIKLMSSFGSNLYR